MMRQLLNPGRWPGLRKIGPSGRNAPHDWTFGPQCNLSPLLAQKPRPLAWAKEDRPFGPQCTARLDVRAAIKLHRTIGRSGRDAIYLRRWPKGPNFLTADQRPGYDNRLTTSVQ